MADITITSSSVNVTDAVGVFGPQTRQVVRAAPLSWLNNFFSCMDNHVMNDAMLDEYQKILFMFEQELLDRGLRHEFLDRMLTLHVLPHTSRSMSRDPCQEIRLDSQCSSPIPRTNANLTYVPTTSSSATITTMVESQSTHFNALMSNMHRISSNIGYDVNVSQPSTQSSSTNYSFQQDPYYVALSSASAKLTQMQDDLHSAMQMADVAAPQIPLAARQHIFRGLYNSVRGELDNLAKSCNLTSQNNVDFNNYPMPTASSNYNPVSASGAPMMCSAPISSTSSSYKLGMHNVDPNSVCYSQFVNTPPYFGNVTNPNSCYAFPPNSNVVNNPNVGNTCNAFVGNVPNVSNVGSNSNFVHVPYVANLPNISNLSLNQPVVVPTPVYPQYMPVANVNFDKLIPRFTTPYYLWAAQVRKLLNSRGFNDLTNPYYMSVIGSAIINRLPSNAALAAPTSDVESLLQFLEGYDRHRRDVFEVLGKDGKFQNKPSIHYFLKCAEIRQADTANLTDQQIQLFAWQSMQKLFPAELRSYIAMVSQGNRLPSHDQWDTIDKLWSESISQKKTENVRSAPIANVQPTVSTEAESVAKLTSELSKAINTFTKQFTSKSGNSKKPQNNSGNNNSYNGSNYKNRNNFSNSGQARNSKNNNANSSQSSSSRQQRPAVGVTLQERGVDMSKYYYARYPNRKDLCYYHQLFGPSANRCKQNGCQWEENRKALLNRSKNNSNDFNQKND